MNKINFSYSLKKNFFLFFILDKNFIILLQNYNVNEGIK